MQTYAELHNLCTYVHGAYSSFVPATMLTADNFAYRNFLRMDSIAMEALSLPDSTPIGEKDTPFPNPTHPIFWRKACPKAKGQHEMHTRAKTILKSTIYVPAT